MTRQIVFAILIIATSTQSPWSHVDLQGTASPRSIQLGYSDSGVLATEQQLRRLFLPWTTSVRRNLDQPTPLVPYKIPTPGAPLSEPGPPTTVYANCIVTATTTEQGTPIGVTYERFNEKSLAVLSRVDLEADGTIDATSWLAYKNGDLLTEYRSDSDGDGFAEYNQFRLYDSDDKLVLISFDYDGDGVREISTSYGYRSDGHTLTSMEWTSTLGSDVLQLSKLFRYAIDAPMLEHFYEAPKDIWPAHETDYDWLDGLLITTTGRSGTPLKPSWHRSLTYNSSRQLTSSTFAADDQSFRSRSTYEYNETGLVSRISYYTGDDLEEVNQFEYDLRHRLVRQKRFRDVVTYGFSCPD